MNVFSKLRGTIEKFFQIGLGGPQFKNDTGEIDARDAADAIFVNVRGADPVIDDDLTTKRYVDALAPSAGSVSYTPTDPNNWPNPPEPTNVQEALDDVAWARGFEVNFVTDCGADPTGIADCAPAFDRAFALLSALAGSSHVKSGRLFIPRGQYNLLSAPLVAWNFTGTASAISVYGDGMDSTIFLLNGFDLPAIQNLYECEVSDLTLFGAGNGATNDCTFGWAMEFIFKLATFRRIHCFNIKALNSALAIAVTQAVSRVSECVVTCCSSQTDLFGCVYIQGFTDTSVENSTFTDVGNMNGIPQNGTKLAGNRTWLQIKSNSAFSGIYVQAAIRNCFFDENVKRNVYILGEVAAPIRNVIIENVLFNPPVQPGQIVGIEIDHALAVTMNGVIDTGLVHSSTVGAISLVDVGETTIRGLNIDTTSPSRSVSADANCGYLELQASNVADVDVLSSAALTTIKSNGQTADLFVANGAILAHQLAKDVPGGPIPITVSDQISVVTGAARQATTGAAQNVSLSRFGTPTTFLSDGSATIAVGDNLGISPTSAGRVRMVPAGVDRVGVATAAVGAVANALVSGYFSPLGSDPLAFQTFSANNPTLVSSPGGMVNVVQPGVVNANLPDLTTIPLGESIVVLCDGIASATVTAHAGQTIQEVGAGAPATPQTVTGVATFFAFSATTWIMSP